MTNLFEWIAAIAMVALIVVILLAVATVIGGGAVILLASLLIAAGMDVLLTPFRWFSSLSPFEGTEKGEREEDAE